MYHQHEQLGAKIVDFGGWDMPLHYGSQIDEHHTVRQSAGMFDVSHMTVIALQGREVPAYLDRLLANDFSRITRPGQAMYSGMLDENGGVLDDLIVYNTGDPTMVVVNCATREKDIAWMQQVAEGFDCSVEEHPGLAIIAIQGPEAIDLTRRVVSDAMVRTIDGLKVFQGAWCEGWLVACTGYTGEKGLEIILPGDEAPALWAALSEAGVRPIGLGARDTLRLEAGMNLYGSDMDETVTPLESNTASTVYLEGRSFIGAERLREQTGGDHPSLIGLVMTAKGVLRAHYPVFASGEPVGEITSGAFSPTLGHAIALARVSSVTDDMAVEIRGKMLPVSAVTTPFVRNGKQVYRKLELDQSR